VILSPAQAEALERSCFADAWDAATLASLLRNPALAAWGWEAEGGTAAYLVFQRVADEAEILRIGVPPERRRKGHGGRLLAHFLDWAAGEGITRVHLEVRDSNAAALALYRGAGFREVSRREGYYRDPAEDALLLEWRAGAWLDD